jgi:PhzF family phenazine biosynthesis protein
MKLPVYIVDAFTDKLFGGNPAAVCPLEHWLDDQLMQSIATENHLSETVFFIKNDGRYDIRWFTPATEVKLCGHATLASAHIMFTELGHTEDVIEFNSLSGLLKVERTADRKIQLNFPADKPEKIDDIPDELFEGLGIKNALVYKSFDYMVVLPTQAEVERLNPDFKTLAKVKARGVIATAKGDEADFISRCFFPQCGIDEDPVTGSAHTITVPYWAEQLGKTKLKAIQLSKRRGYLDCELVEDRVLMSGGAVTYLRGEYSV